MLRQQGLEVRKRSLMRQEGKRDQVESMNIDWNPRLSHPVSDLIGTDDSQKKLELFATKLYTFRMYPTF